MIGAFAWDHHPKDLSHPFAHAGSAGAKAGRGSLADGIARTGHRWSGEFRRLCVSRRLAAEYAGSSACETTSEELEQLAT